MPPTNGQVVRQRRPWQFEGGVSAGGGVYEATRVVNITAAQIIATTAGGLGHANGFELVPAPPANFFLELVSAALIYTFGVAAYTAGGNLTINEAAGSAITGLISAANSLGAAVNKFALFNPLAAAARNAAQGVAFNLVSSAAFTNPGTATGIVRVNVTYRVHPGL